MKTLISTLILVLALFTVPVHAQTPIPFTLSWQPNTQISTKFYVHSLLTYNGQPASSSVCGYTEENYLIWCGEVVHYTNPPLNEVDFNFPDNFLLEGCSQSSSVSSTVVTSPGRRTITTNQVFACTDANADEWTVQTTTKTKQFQASCGRYACWGTFGPGQQSPITGTVTQD